MTSFQIFWLGQAALTTVVTLGFLLVLRRAIIGRRGQPVKVRRDTDHSVVVATGLVLIAAGNVVTSASIALDISGGIEMGGIVIRGVLLTLSIYLVAVGPWHPRRRGDDFWRRWTSHDGRDESTVDDARADVEGHRMGSQTVQQEIEQWATMARLLLRHIEKGRGIDNPKVRTDFATALSNNQRIVDRYHTPAGTDARVAFLTREMVRVHREQEDAVGRLDAIKTALDRAASTAADEAVQVQAHFAALRDQVAALQAQIDELTAGSVTQAEIDELAAQADAISTTVEAIDTEGDVAPPAEGETPVP
jgi:hypothetical protein